MSDIVVETDLYYIISSSATELFQCTRVCMFIDHVYLYRNMNTFDREAFGRRSFSEKRKASNGKNKEVVAKVKALREEMKLENASLQTNTTTGKSVRGYGCSTNNLHHLLELSYTLAQRYCML